MVPVKQSQGPPGGGETEARLQTEVLQQNRRHPDQTRKATHELGGSLLKTQTTKLTLIGQHNYNFQVHDWSVYDTTSTPANQNSHGSKAQHSNIFCQITSLDKKATTR